MASSIPTVRRPRTAAPLRRAILVATLVAAFAGCTSGAPLRRAAGAPAAPARSDEASAMRGDAAPAPLVRQQLIRRGDMAIEATDVFRRHAVRHIDCDHSIELASHHRNSREAGIRSGSGERKCCKCKCDDIGSQHACGIRQSAQTLRGKSTRRLDTGALPYDEE